MAGDVQLVIVYEDQSHGVFARAFLYRRGFKPKELYEPPCPRGRGDAKHHVYGEFCRQLASIRRFGGRRALLLVIDADNLSVENRRQSIGDACRAYGIEPPGANEAVFCFIPKWEIENWLAYLRGEAVDEDVNTYQKYTGRESEIYPLVEPLADRCQNREKLPGTPPPSLMEACKVYDRFIQWKKGS